MFVVFRSWFFFIILPEPPMLWSLTSGILPYNGGFACGIVSEHKAYGKKS
jgi:hypothetical protein